jgi:ABC-type microcin C transport system duplicated ATPase subunit YejF
MSVLPAQKEVNGGPAATERVPLLEVRNLEKRFPIVKGLFSRVSGQVHAVDGVSFHIDPGETLGLVGESGCGKSTVGRTLLKLLEPTAGSIRVAGEDITALDAKAMLPYRKRLQMIYQDPYASLNPRMSAGQIVGEPLVIHGVGRLTEQRFRTSFPAASASASALPARLLSIPS